MNIKKFGIRTKLRNNYYKLRNFGVSHDKLHLGSGKVILPGFLNIDFDNSFGSEVLPLDLRDPLPFPDSSVSLIYSEHTIEHLSKNDGIKLLKECFRVLKKGGVIRFGFPDFTKHINAYLKKNSKYRAGMHVHMGPSFTQSWDEFIADLLYSWDHRYCYTPELLKSFFKIADFEKIEIKQYKDSDLGFIYDTRDFPDTTYVEAIKN